MKWSRPNRLIGVSGSGADKSLIHSDERLVAHFDADQQHLVERVEDRDLEQDRQAARRRIDLLVLVELQDFLLLPRLVVLEALLDAPSSSAAPCASRPSTGTASARSGT